MKRILLILLLCALMMPMASVGATASDPKNAVTNEILPGTWAAVDGLGRTLSSAAQVGTEKKDKYVGCFYWDWHYMFSAKEPRNITQIINQYPEAQNDINHAAWGKDNVMYPYFWDEPLFGYYQTEDTYVLRKHAELLADAGIDYIVFDCTNGTNLFSRGYEAVFEAFAEAKKDGVDVPQIAFFLSWFDTDDRIQLRNLYKDIYSKGKYQDLWFYWEGKPLVMSHIGALDESDPTDKAILDFFTFRHCKTSYFDTQFSYASKIWGWCSVYPQTKFGVKPDGSIEMMCVSVAQNANETWITAMNDPKGNVRGRGYAKGDYSYSYTNAGRKITIDKNTKDAYLYGLNFQQQWDYAIENDPQVIFITGWNEYVTQLATEFQGVQCAFSDNFTAEYSRDIEPSAGILKDHFYNQMVENIRRFKGVPAVQTASTETGVYKTINIGNSGNKWDQVKLAYNHYTNSTLYRDFNGFKGVHYTNKTMRNDFVQSKVAYDDSNIYFMVETVDDITASSDPAWMRLFIDTDTTGVTPNWEGFEYVINRRSPSDDKVYVEVCDGGWNFRQIGVGSYAVSGNRLEIAVPRACIGMDGENISFNFKWADNTRADGSSDDSGDILDFYQYGDVAPGGRFAFSFTTRAFSSGGGNNTTNSILLWTVVICAVAIVVTFGCLSIILYRKKEK